MTEVLKTEHLSEAQWLELAGAEAGAEAREHLSQCADCANELARLRRTLESFRRDAQNAAARPESFWLRQRTHVVSHALGRRAVPRLTWAVTVAAVLLAAIVLARQTPVPATPDAQDTARVALTTNSAARQTLQNDSDSALLVDVHRYLERDVPQALDPAALLVEEMNQNAADRRNP